MSGRTLLQNATLCVPRPSVAANSKEALNLADAIVARSTIDPGRLPVNHVVIRVDRFGFSANNVSYQALGEHPHFRYFDFHAAPTSELTGTHGVIPVWGFGTVVVSTHSKIHVGERVYGYFAPVKYLVVPVSPSDVNKYAFYIPRPHLPNDRRPYNQVLRCATDSQYTAGEEGEDLTMLYRPLFWTSYWCEDWLHSTGSYKADPGVNVSILVASASSKTAFSLAYLILKRIRSGELKNASIIGLTSRRNLEFTKRLGLYHEVYEYDSFASGKAFQEDKGRRWLYVDVAGNDSLNARIKAHFASPAIGRIVKNVALGVTNLTPSTSANDEMKWTHNPFDPKAPVFGDPANRWPTVEHFFMPEWLNVRKYQLPLQEIFKGQDEAWGQLMKDCQEWVTLERVYGAESVREEYIRVAKGGLGPDKGLVWSLWDAHAALGKASPKL